MQVGLGRAKCVSEICVSSKHLHGDAKAESHTRCYQALSTYFRHSPSLFANLILPHHFQTMSLFAVSWGEIGLLVAGVLTFPHPHCDGALALPAELFNFRVAT